MLNRLSICLCLFAFLSAISYIADDNQTVFKGDPDHWTHLFNGKDLAGWKIVYFKEVSIKPLKK